jgi:hypothetical protein
MIQVLRISLLLAQWKEFDSDRERAKLKMSIYSDRIEKMEYQPLS